MPEHKPTLKQGPSGVRTECSCGWGGMPRYTAEHAYAEHAQHVRNVQAEQALNTLTRKGDR